MTAADFTDDVRNAKRGDRIVYHMGFLFADRQRHKAVHATGSAAWREYEAGNVALVQRRIDDKGCEYIAVVL